MSEQKFYKVTTGFLFIVLAAWLAARLIGSDPFSNTWSFAIWSMLPGWWTLVWAAALVGLLAGARYFGDRIGDLLGSRAGLIVTSVMLLVLFWVFRIDSVLPGGGTLAIAQIAQVDVVIYPWFEWGTIALVTLLFNLVSLFESNPTYAGVLAWRALAMLSSALTLWASIRIVSELSRERSSRFWLFLVIVFGPQAIEMLGDVGPAVLIVPITLWFGLYTLQAVDTPSTRDILSLWTVTAIGVIMHYTLAYLVPVALFVSLAATVERNRTPIVGVTTAAVSLVALILLLYNYAGDHFAFGQRLLFAEGSAPFTDYALLSGRRIGDILQVFFLVAPLVLVAKLIGLTDRGWWRGDRLLWSAWLMAFCGTVVFLILNPVNSIVLDLPRLAAYLSPYGFLFALLLNRRTQADSVWRRLPRLWAVASIVLLAGYAATFANIDNTVKLAERYFQRHEKFYRSGVVAIRDAYFARKDFDKANFWDTNRTVKSPDHLNLQGCLSLVAQQRFDAAITTLGRLIARDPYWHEPREMLAMAYIQQGNPHLARPQLDTLLMLKPYRKGSLMTSYAYYRALGQFERALQEVELALEYYPGDRELLLDKMLLTYQHGNPTGAVNLANRYIAEDTTYAGPHWVIGQIAEASGDLARAIENYQAFLKKEPDHSLSPIVEQRLQQLRPPAPDTAN